MHTFFEEKVEIKAGRKRFQISFNAWAREKSTQIKVFCTKVWTDEALMAALKLYYRQRSWAVPAGFMCVESDASHRIFQVLRATVSDEPASDALE